MPRFQYSGSLKQNGVNYRFMLTEGVREDNKVGFVIGDKGKVYLVDIGLACRYTQNGKHKEYKEDLRKALPGVDGGTHLCVMPTHHRHLSTPVHFHDTPPAAELQGDVDVFFFSPSK
ncbi:hypothetical protein MTO96_024951 [Rhipicephalus appendiculatus]